MSHDEEVSLRIEAREVMKEVAYAVHSVEISKELKSTDRLVHMNLRTKEDQEFSVELTDQGFRVVGKMFDTRNEKEYSQYFETIYALLDHHSPEYRKSFGDTLLKKLEILQLSRDDENGDIDTEEKGEDPP